MSMKHLIFILAILLLGACKGSRSTETTVYQERDSVRTVVIREQVLVPAEARVETVVKYVDMPVGYPVYVEDSTSQARLRLLRNEYDELLASCESAPAPIIYRDTCEQLTTREREYVQEQTTVRRNRWGLAEWLIMMLVVIVAAILFKR